MKKIKILTLSIFCLFLLQNVVNAQLVRVKGKKYVEYSTGFNTVGFNQNVQFGLFLFKGFNLRSGFQYERLNLDYSHVNRFGFNVDALYNIYQYNGVIFLDLKASLFTGFENSKHYLFEKYSSMIVGESIGLKFEYMFLPNVSASLTGEQKFIQLSDITTKTWSINIGASYHF
jgi:hypothetical protein